MEEDGVDVVSLESLVEKEFKKRLTAKDEESQPERFWSMFYTIPTYHNPTGILTSPAKCQKIMEIARKFDLVQNSAIFFNYLCTLF